MNRDARMYLPGAIASLAAIAGGHGLNKKRYGSKRGQFHSLMKKRKRANQMARASRKVNARVARIGK